MKRKAFSLIQALIAALLFAIGMQSVFSMMLIQIRSYHDLRQSRTAWRLLLNCATLEGGAAGQPASLHFDQRGVFDSAANHFEVQFIGQTPASVQVRMRSRNGPSLLQLRRTFGGDL